VHLSVDITPKYIVGAIWSVVVAFFTGVGVIVAAVTAVIGVGGHWLIRRLRKDRTKPGEDGSGRPGYL
jgi:hypothetical protein